MPEIGTTYYFPIEHIYYDERRLPCSEYIIVESKFILDRFGEMWDSTIKKKGLPLYGWEANPWVWVIEFKRIEKL